MLSVARTLILLTLSRAAVVIQAAPTVSFPINSQVPPVARISQPFSFIFSSSTFTSSSGSTLAYSLTDPPSWLSIDSDNRTLYGTPQDGDIAAGTVVGVPIVLVATDLTGSTPQNATLVVSRDAGPTVEIPVSDQIQSFGAYSDPSSILQYPENPFKFSFAQNTFTDPTTSDLDYYAVTIDNSPLPAWVSFNPDTLEFVGTTPPFYSLIEPPQTFPLKLIASDVKGFSAASVNFSIVVGSHSLTAGEPTVTLDAAAGTPLTYDGLVGNIKIDGQQAAVGDVSNVSTENLPSWLTFDPSSWAISGTPPDTAQSTSFTVMMEDTYLDTLNVTFEVQVATRDSAFQAAFPTLDLKPGSKLSFDLRPYLLDPSEVDVTADIQPSTSWLEFDASSLTLSGRVPKKASKSVINVTFSASSKHARLKRDGTTQTQKLTIQVVSAADTISSTSSATSSTPSVTTSTPRASASPGDNPTKQRSSPVLIAVLVSAIVAVLLIICLLFCFYRRRQKRHSRTPLEGNESCGPKPGSFIHTQGFDPESSVLDLSHEQYEVVRTKSAAEKTKPRKPSNLRLEYTGSPDVMTPPLPVIVYDIASASQTNFSPSKAWLAPLRNFRIPHLKRTSIRASESFFDDDDRHGLGLNFPPPITLSRGSQSSFRNDIEVAIPTVEREDSIQQTPEIAYGPNSMVRDPPPRNPARVQTPNEAVDNINRDISPVDHSEIVNEKSRQPAEDPQSQRHPALRHEKSQKSFASFSSIDTFKDQTRKLAAKATASAKGAASIANSAIVQVPKRKTLRALGKARLHFNESPTAGQGIFETVSPIKGDFDYINIAAGGAYISPRSWPQNDPGAPSTVPVPRIPAEAVALDSENHRRRRSRMSGSSSSRSSHLSLGHNRTSHGVSLGTGATRRPSNGGGGGGGNPPSELPAFPTPLRVRNPDAGLGISGYEDIANSSPFRPSRSSNSWSTVQTGLSGGFDRPVTAKTTQSATGRSFRSGTWNEPNVVIHEEESPTFEEAVDWLGGVTSGGSRQDNSNDYRRKSLTRSRGSMGSGESDGPPAFL
ncbi:hypothetical protein VMCG_09059 [Cytospora schulzeri]|uniref:Dystroglycan-type cadherin-like domain-containing protein n=1 Tax=Cytospora schulzeri TaxID=448051 RepID=A0A423VP96_9PEZI|nr:hypothetical protein VMCG_09059 [Valsa malicola]